MSGTTAKLVNCISSNEFNTACAWTISDSSYAYGAINSYGTYTGSTANAPFKITVTYKNDSDETATADYSATEFYYTITKTAHTTSTAYSKTSYAYSDGKIYYVKYYYCKLTGYDEGQITCYLDGTDTTINSSITKDGVTYSTITNLKYFTATGWVTVNVAQLTAEVDFTEYYVDKITKTEICSSVGTIFDNALFTRSYSLDYGTFYNQTYSSSDIMGYLAKDSWNDGSTNQDMVGKIFRLASGDSKLKANQYVKVGGFYTVYYDEDKGTYSLKAIANIDYVYGDLASDDNSNTVETNDEYDAKALAGHAKLINMRMLTVLTNSYSWYGQTSNEAHTGTGGSYTVTITAFLHKETDETDSSYTDETKNIYEDTTRMYQINVVG